MAQGERDVPHHDHEGPQGEQVVREGGALSPRDREESEPLQNVARREQYDDRRNGEDRIRLLARIELVCDEWRTSEGPQPSDLGARPSADPPPVVAHPAAPWTQESNRDGQWEQEAGPQVDHLDRVPWEHNAEE